jgi:hypothetical protein
VFFRGNHFGEDVCGQSAGCARLNAGAKALNLFSQEIELMSRKPKQPTFEQVLDTLRAHAFAVSALPGGAGHYLVSKYSCGAVLAAGSVKAGPVKAGPASKEPTPVVEVETARFEIGGELATLVDRGYQKFLKTSKFEVAATAEALQAIHRFQEELKQITGETVLFNQGLGTTSDEYLYDRLKGRDKEAGRAHTPWEIGAGH